MYIPLYVHTFCYVVGIQVKFLVKIIDHYVTHHKIFFRLHLAETVLGTGMCLCYD